MLRHKLSSVANHGVQLRVNAPKELLMVMYLNVFKAQNPKKFLKGFG
jgi:hypothetical protein